MVNDKYLTSILGMVLLVAALGLTVAARGAGPLLGDIEVTRGLQTMMPVESGWGSRLGAIENVVWFAPLLLIALMLLLRRWRSALLLLIGTLGSIVVGILLVKPLVARPRPNATLVRLYEQYEGFSFPSSTTLLATVLGGLLIYELWNARRLLLRNASLVVVVALVLLTSLARVQVGAHWLTDVVGSWLWGSVVLVLVLMLPRRWLRRGRS